MSWTQGPGGAQGHQGAHQGGGAGEGGCPRCHSPLGSGDLRCAVCALPVPAAADAAGKVVARILRCEGCGAALTYDVRVQAPKCAFCGSIAHLEESEDPIEEAELYLPFRVSPEQAHQALGQWLSTLGWFRPSDLASQASIDSLKPLWWVGWTFDVDALVSWTADSNAGAGRSAWAPHSGQSGVSMRGQLVSASRGLTEGETSQLASYFDLRSGVPQPHEMPGATVERFDVQRSSARKIVANGVRAAAKAQASQWVPGSRMRKLSVAILPRRLVTRRYAFPTYVLAYRYRDKLYRALVHGQDASCVFGKAPWSVWKILAVVLGSAALIALIVAAVMLAKD